METTRPSPADAARADRRAGRTDRVLTIPNLITALRLACIPVFLYLLFGRGNRAAAAWLLAALGMSDWVDGWLARRFGQVSELGKVLDPLADRLVLLVGVTAILVDGSAPLWVGVLVVVREALVAGTTLVLAALGARRIDVTWWGKAGTFALLWAFPLWLGGSSTLSYAPLANFLAWCSALPGLVLSYYSAALYVPRARAALAEGRRQQRGGRGRGRARTTREASR